VVGDLYGEWREVCDLYCRNDLIDCRQICRVAYTTKFQGRKTALRIGEPEKDRWLDNSNMAKANMNDVLSHH
jgi:hypothetical protein